MAAYGGVVERLTRRVQRRFDEIEAVANNNFEYGPEFEIAVAEMLREFLPPRFGVCRGYIVTSDGTSAGDDIIVFDRDYPTLRFLGESLALKEQVPYEAVYAYLEAKHTLHLEGAESNRTSFAKAIAQLRKVAALPARVRTTSFQIDRHTGLAPGPTTGAERHGWDVNFANPLYLGIVARNCIISTSERRSPTVHEAVASIAPFQTNGIFPTLVSAGDLIINPVFGPHREHVPFLGAPGTGPGYAVLPGGTFGLGVLHLLWAIEQVKLGSIDWTVAISDAINQRQVM